MAAQLLIGDAAKLAGVTPKTIRHYHKLGLLAEPERTAAGYRLYTANHLLRLHQIKQLQGLGLSLQQIGQILSEAAEEQSIEGILRVLHAEVVAQIEELQERRDQIEALLAEDAPGLLAGEETPPTLKLLQEQLGEQLQIDWSHWAGRSKQFAQLDALLWMHADYQEQQRALVEQITSHPDEFRQVIALMAQVTGLATAPEESPLVEQLADEIVRLHSQNSILARITAATFSGQSTPEMWDELMGEVGGGPLSPAQQRLFQLVAERLGMATKDAFLD